jgi:uncharacterized protein involved in exopolysaccharide biosynthesis
MEALDTSGPGRSLGWKRLILILVLPALSGFFGGFLSSYLFPPRYVSQSVILVESQRLPAALVMPITTDDLSDRVSAVEMRILGRSSLLPMIQRLGLVKNGRTPEMAMTDIRANLAIDPVISDAEQITGPTTAKTTAPEPNAAAPAFTVSFTASNPQEARDVCTELTSMLLEENIKSRETLIAEMSDFVSRELDDAKRSLEAMDERPLKRSAPVDGTNIAGVSATEIEHEAEKKKYTDLLYTLNQTQASLQLTKDAEAQQLGEQWRLVQPAGLPRDLSFPNRWECALSGLGIGLVFGIVIALRAWFNRRSSKPAYVDAVSTI